VPFHLRWLLFQTGAKFEAIKVTKRLGDRTFRTPSIGWVSTAMSETSMFRKPGGRL